MSNVKKYGLSRTTLVLKSVEKYLNLGLWGIKGQGTGTDLIVILSLLPLTL